MVTFEVAARDRHDVRLLNAEQLFPGRTQHSLQWRVTLHNRPKLGVVPDAVLALETTTQGGEASRAYYFLEADRGTMPIIRHDFPQTSFFRKLLAYHATWNQDLHRTRLGIPRFRVLRVTSNPERMELMIKACGQLEGGQGLFLFAEASPLIVSDFFNFPWQTNRGEHVTLLDE